MNSKQVLSLIFLSAGVSNLSFASVPTVASPCASHQFIPRSASEDLTWIDALTRYDLIHRRGKDGKPVKYAFNSTSVYQQSTKCSNSNSSSSSSSCSNFASSFLLGNGNNYINVAQTPVANTTVNSLQLGLAQTNPDLTPFSSTFTINPSRRLFTYVGNLYANLEDWWCGLWGDITFGVTNVHHRMNCSEVTTGVSTLYPNISFITNGIQNVTASLSDRPDLNYSQFYCGNCADGKRRTGFEDIQVRLGYNHEWCDDAHIGIYGIFTIPAGRNPTQQYIFEPLVGSKHWSVGVGFMGDYAAWCDSCGDSNLTLLTDFNYRYVLSHKECRTFDLLPNGPFSRYILVVSPNQLGEPFPAADITTISVKVNPRSTIQWWIGANYEYCDWDFEVGYNLYWRQSEQIKSSSVAGFTTADGIYDLIGGGASRVTASDTTMTTVGTPDATFIAITAADLNLASAQAGKVLSNKVYGALSWMGCACDCFDWMAGFGGSYEFVVNHDKCNALNSWAVFGKFAVGF